MTPLNRPGRRQLHVGKSREALAALLASRYRPGHAEIALAILVDRTDHPAFLAPAFAVRDAGRRVALVTAPGAFPPC